MIKVKNEKTNIQNRKARHEYFILEETEAGIVLTGSEIKSLREGKANIQDAFAEERKGEIWLLNAHISEYKGSNRFNHKPLRPRKLLLHKKEIKKLIGKIREKGVTLIPISLYINSRNIAKLKLALAKGKKLYDKRADLKEKEWKRDKERIVKERLH